MFYEKCQRVAMAEWNAFAWIMHQDIRIYDCFSVRSLTSYSQREETDKTSAKMENTEKFLVLLNSSCV